MSAVIQHGPFRVFILIPARPVGILSFMVCDSSALGGEILVPKWSQEEPIKMSWYVTSGTPLFRRREVTYSLMHQYQCINNLRASQNTLTTHI